MYLSRLILNPRSRQVQRELADPYQMHRTIMSAFPEKLAPDERVLFRVDSERRNALPALLVQSVHQPDWSGLSVSGGYLLPPDALDGTGDNPAVKRVQLRFQAGQHLLFRLRANPTVKRNGKRHGLLREEQQFDWLRRKLEAAGCELLSANASQAGAVQGLLYRDQQAYNLRFFAVTYDGLLAVRQPEALLQAVQDGIGSGKGLGFGLLSLAAAR